MGAIQVGDKLEVRCEKDVWQRAVVTQIEGRAGIVLASLDSEQGSDTLWTFAEECRHIASTKPTTQPGLKSKSAQSAATKSAPSDSQVQAMGYDLGAKPGECIGTFRYDEYKQLMKLPATAHWTTPPLLQGWRPYLEDRFDPQADGSITIEPSLLDGVSYPLSLLFALQKLRLRPPEPGPLKLVVIGAAAKAEERLLHASNYWAEIGHFMPHTQVQMYFVGPEMSSEHHLTSVKVHKNVQALCFRGPLRDFFAQYDCQPADTIVVGFNTGSGSGLFDLMWSWIPDLMHIVQSGMVAVFTCANDYSDLRGELEVMVNVLGANVVLGPLRNPFKAMTVVREDEGSNADWSCSSSFMYAVQGVGATAQASGNIFTQVDEQLRKRLKKLSKHLLATQQPSPVP